MDNIVNRYARDTGVTLLWCASTGFLLGVFMRSVEALPSVYGFYAGCIAGIILALGSMRSRHLRISIIAAISVLAFGGGILRMGNAILVPDPVFLSSIGTTIEIEGVVSGEPDNRAIQVRVPIYVISLASTSVSTTILAIFPAHTNIYYGEHIRASGTLALPQTFDAGGGRIFDYPQYLAAQGVQFEMDHANLIQGEGFNGNFFVASAYRIKQLFVSGLQQSLPEPHAGLAGGITVGDKRSLGKEITEEFRNTSLLHIIVLSGYNITVVIGSLFYILKSTHRHVRFAAGAFVALFFAVMTGFAAASLRAALMALIAISGSLSGRIYRPERALILVGVGMVIWNPYMLVFDPGFQLSFLATGGLMALTPLYSEKFSWMPNATLREILVSTMSAQTAVLPLLLYESGTLSLVAIPANLLVLTVIPTTMFVAAFAAIAGILIPPLGPLLGFPAFFLLSYILEVVHVMARLPFAALTIGAFSAGWLVPMYVGIAIAAYLFWPSKKEKAALPRGFLENR